MEEQGITRFPIIVYLPQEKSDPKFFLVSTPEALPINKNMTVFATCADNNTLESVRRAYTIGYSMGLANRDRE